MMKNTEKLIREISSCDPEKINGAVIIHMDKETKQVISISPVLPVKTIDKLYEKLADTRDAIQAFLDDLTNRILKKNGQSN